MRRLIFVVVASGVALGLLAGCSKRERPAKAERPDIVRPEMAPEAEVVAAPKRPLRPIRTPRPRQEITPGSVKFLDYKNGFRDAAFGRPASSLTNLLLKTQDDHLQLKTFTRTGDRLSLGGVPLESIEYSFFNDRLCRVLIQWRVVQTNMATKETPTETLVPFCVGLYGRPRRHSLRNGGAELDWRGRRVELTLSESSIPGVRDKIRGGWAIPPTTTGLMIFESIQLRRALAVMLADATERRKDGL